MLEDHMSVRTVNMAWRFVCHTKMKKPMFISMGFFIKFLIVNSPI